MTARNTEVKVIYIFVEKNRKKFPTKKSIVALCLKSGLKFFKWLFFGRAISALNTSEPLLLGHVTKSATRKNLFFYGLELVKKFVWQKFFFESQTLSRVLITRVLWCSMQK